MNFICFLWQGHVFPRFGNCCGTVSAGPRLRVHVVLESLHGKSRSQTAACPGVFIPNPSQWVLIKEITTSYYLIVYSQMLHMQPENSNIECAPHMFCVTLLFVASCLPLQVQTNKTLPGSAKRSPATFFRVAGLSSWSSSQGAGETRVWATWEKNLHTSLAGKESTENPVERCVLTLRYAGAEHYDKNMSRNVNTSWKTTLTSTCHFNTLIRQDV